MLLMYTMYLHACCVFFFFTDPSTPEIYTLSLHDALPISTVIGVARDTDVRWILGEPRALVYLPFAQRYDRSEEHTSELQSLRHLVCRLLLEKKKKRTPTTTTTTNHEQTMRDTLW